MRRAPRFRAPTRCLTLGALALAAAVGARRADAQSAAAHPAAAHPANAAAMTKVGTKAGPWRPLLSATSADAWRAYRGSVLPAGWTVANGVLTKEGEHEDLISRDEFGDFELQWQWKLSPGGNAGVFYRVTEAEAKPYWTGPEYQLLDDAGHPDGKSRLTAAGAAYGLYPAPTGAVKPANQWNTSRLVVRGAHVEHWLNGVKTADYTLWSPDWEAKVKASKFNAYPAYGRARRGHLALQGDHNGTLAIRDLRIREFQ